MRFYVTFFDRNYLTRGLVMYYSLLENSEEFHLWVICFDDIVYELLSKLNLAKITLVSLSQFEDQELLRIKPQRTSQEYFWTCTPSVLLYVLNTESYVDNITYLDADLMFFSSPEPIFDEAEDASIILTQHRYITGFDQSAKHGIYNVQFMRFCRNSQGLEALNWWRDRCLEWCFAKVENDKFGDQKYLDDWRERFTSVHIVRHLGAGLAPWNAAQYSLKKIKSKVWVEEKYPVIFYHFHKAKIFNCKIGYYFDFFPINNDLTMMIYKPYFQELIRVHTDLKKEYPKLKFGIANFFDLLKHPRLTFKDIKQGRYCRIF